MTQLLIGYARVSTDTQDLTAQRDALDRLGVPAERIHVDHGLTGTNRDRPGLKTALAACREGDTLVVTKLDRLARSLADACMPSRVRRRSPGPRAAYGASSPSSTRARKHTSSACTTLMSTAPRSS